jgi:hypothetical protein
VFKILYKNNIYKDISERRKGIQENYHSNSLIKAIKLSAEEKPRGGGGRGGFRKGRK